MMRARRFISGLFIVAVLTGCGNDASDDTITTTTSPVTTVTPTNSVESTTIAPDGAEEAPEAIGVVLAAVLLAAGDVESGVAGGVVAPAEVDQAAVAIETGTLDTWIARAVEELGS